MNIADVAFGLGSQPMPQPGGSIAAGFFAALEAAMAPGTAGLPGSAGIDGASAVPAATPGSATVNPNETTAPNVPQVLAMLGTTDTKPALATPGTAAPAAAAQTTAAPIAAAQTIAAPIAAAPATLAPTTTPPSLAAPHLAEAPGAIRPPATAPKTPTVVSDQSASAAPPAPATAAGKTAKRAALVDPDGIERDRGTPEQADPAAAAPRGTKSARPAKPTATLAPAALDKQPAAEESADASATRADVGSPQVGADTKQDPAEAAAVTPDAQPQPQPSSNAASAEATMLAVAASAVVPIAAAPQQQSKPAAPAGGPRAVAARAPRANATTDAATAQAGDTAPSRGTARSERAAAPQFQSKLADAESDADDAPTQKLAALGETARGTPAPLPAAAETPRAHAPAAAPTPPASAAEPSISARHGEIGRALGVEVARRVSEGGEELRVRLNPAEFGRVEVKIAFDDGGTLRATVHAENPAALDMLRRDSADLSQAMGDAGVRADAQSFRFESRADSQQRQQQQTPRHAETSGSATPFMDDTLPEAALAAYRPVRTPGRVDLLA